MEAGRAGNDVSEERAAEPELGEARFWVRTVLPLARYFAGFPPASELFEPVRNLDPDGQIGAEQVCALIAQAVAVTGEEAAGLKVGRTLQHGEAGAIDYIISSASTLGAAAEVGARSLRLVHNALSLRLFRDGVCATVRFDSRMPWAPVMSDFLLAAVFSNHLRAQLSDLRQLEVWFAHEPPGYREQYELTFAPAQLRFSAPFFGFRLPASELERPLAKADPYLHGLLCKHVVEGIDGLPSAGSFKDRVSTLLGSLLSSAEPPSAGQVAARLGLSTRTLARRLEAEGSTFYAVLDELRQRLALDYVAYTVLPLSEIGRRLGFTHSAAFHRAFRRWTGQTPGTVRKRNELEGRLAARAQLS